MTRPTTPPLPAEKLIDDFADALIAMSLAGEELLGKPIELLVPERFHAAHPGHRMKYFVDPPPRAMGAGLELTRRLKADHSMRGIAVLAMTAYAMKGDDEKARVAGCDGYVTKPIDTRALPGVIADHLASAGRIGPAS